MKPTLIQPTDIQWFRCAVASSTRNCIKSNPSVGTCEIKALVDPDSDRLLYPLWDYTTDRIIFQNMKPDFYISNLEYLINLLLHYFPATALFLQSLPIYMYILFFFKNFYLMNGVLFQWKLYLFWQTIRIHKVNKHIWLK